MDSLVNTDSVLRGTNVQVSYQLPAAALNAASVADWLSATRPSAPADESDLFTPAKSHALKAEGDYRVVTTDVHVLDMGESVKPTIVLLGGLAVPWFDWQDLALDLVASYRVLVIDRAGAGLSGPAPFAEPSSLFAEADVVRQVLDAKDVACAVVVGHSMGGLVAECFARLFPDRCASLALLDPSFEAGAKGSGDASGGGHQVPVPLPALTRFLASQAKNVLRSTWVARAFASLRLGLASSKLDSAVVAEVKAVNRTVFTRPHVLDGAVREYSSYDGWVGQLADLRMARPVTCPVLVVAARSGPEFWSRSWVNDLQSLAALLATEVGAAKVDFEVVRASHMLMRDVPQQLGAFLRTRAPH